MFPTVYSKNQNPATNKAASLLFILATYLLIVGAIRASKIYAVTNHQPPPITGDKKHRMRFLALSAETGFRPLTSPKIPINPQTNP